METRNAIGERLREIRKQRGVTEKELADKLNCPQSRVSRIETGILKPSLDYVTAVAGALRLPQSTTQELRSFTQLFLVDLDRWRPGRPGVSSDLQEKLAQIEHKVRVISGFQWVLIPGLLQTREYARGILRFYEKTAADVDQAVHLRLQRQVVLQDDRKTFSYVIADTALTTLVCPAEAMLQQLSRLEELRRGKNVSISLYATSLLLPQFSVNSFTIYDNTFVEVETEDENLRVWERDRVDYYSNKFKALEASASRSREEFDRLLNLARMRLESLAASYLSFHSIAQRMAPAI